MKSQITSSSTALQHSATPRLLRRFAIYEQYSGRIDSTASAGASITVEGNASSFFAVDDIVICPFYKFESEAAVSSVTYNSLSATTTIVITGATFPDTEGYFLCRLVPVMDKILDKGIKETTQAVEGETLYKFDSGQIDVVFDNNDGFFWNKELDGVFNTDNVFWCKLFTKFQTSSDSELIYFGGMLDLTDIRHDLYNKTVTVRSYGHSYELGRYPAYYINNENTEYFPELSGVRIIDFVESEDSTEGIKDVEYNPFDESKLEIKVDRVSLETRQGILQLEYRYPYYFKWDNSNEAIVGSVTHTDSGSGKKKMSAVGNLGYGVLEFGDSNDLNEYPNYDTLMWALAKRSEDHESYVDSNSVEKMGRPTIRFDEGEKVTCIMRPQRIVKIASGVYTEITQAINTPRGLGSTGYHAIFSANGDSIIIVFFERFWGLEFFGTNFLSSTPSVSFYYSTGGNSFSSAMSSGANGLTDDTNAFSQNGKVRWNTCEGWVSNEMNFSGGNLKGYMIKIVRNSGFSYFELTDIEHIQRVYGKNNDYIEVMYDQMYLSEDKVTENLIVRYDSVADQWKHGVWYAAVAVQELMERASTIANFNETVTPARRVLSDIKFNIQGFNILGKAPSFAFKEKPEMFAVDWTNEIIYVATGNIVWKSTFAGNFEFLAKFEDYQDQLYEGVDMVIVSGYLYCIYAIVPVQTEPRMNNVYSVGTVNLSTGVKSTTLTYTNANHGQYFMRDGEQRHYGTGTGFNDRSIGQGGTYNYGENICITHKQITSVQEWQLELTPRTMHSLDSFTSGSYQNWFFSQQWRAPLLPTYATGPWHFCNSGWFWLDASANPVAETNAISFKFSYGQDGSFLHDAVNGKWYGWKMQYVSTSAVAGYDILTQFVDFLTGTEQRPIYLHTRVDTATPNNFGATHMPSCAALDESNDRFIFGFTIWSDTGTTGTHNARSYSYLSDFIYNGYYDWDSVFWYNGSTYTDITSTVNSGGSLSSYHLGSTSNYIYIGLDERFRSFHATYGGTGLSDLTCEYYNGTTWVECKLHNLFHANAWSANGNYVVSHSPWGDWEKTTVNSSNKYWIRIGASAVTFGTFSFGLLRLVEKIIWCSKDVTAEYHRVPVNIVYNPDDNCIYGCYINKDDTNSDALRWRVFVYDLTNDVFETNVATSSFEDDGNAVFKNFTFDDYTNGVYCIADYIRYKDEPAKLLYIDYSYALSTISISNQGKIDRTEYGTKTSHGLRISSTGVVMGLTRGEKYLLWEYASSFYPRVALAKFKENDTLLDAISLVAQLANCYMMIHSERIIRFVTRGSYNGSMTLEWDKNLNTSIPTLDYWKEFTDAVKCKYTSVIADGDFIQGATGWRKKLMSVDNGLIQNQHIAKSVVDNLYAYYTNYRQEISGVVTPALIQIECLDKFNIIIPDKMLDIDRNVEFIVTEVRLKTNDIVEIKGIEIISGIG